MASSLSIDSLKESIEMLPNLPRDPRELDQASLRDLEGKANQVAVQLKEMHDSGHLGNTDYTEYCRLRDTVVLYQQRLRSHLSPLYQCPPNVLSEILEFYSPAVQVDDSPTRPHRCPIPSIRCPLLTVISRVSFTLYCEVVNNPRLFSTIHLRRNAYCTEHHHPIVSQRIAKLLELAGAHDLHVIVEFVDPSLHSTDVLARISSCPSLKHLQSRPWRALTCIGSSSGWIAALHIDPASFPQPITHSLTILELKNITRLPRFLAILKKNITLQYLTIRLSLDTRDLNDYTDSVTLPATLKHLDLTCGSQTALFLLESATSLPSASVTLTAVPRHTHLFLPEAFEQMKLWHPLTFQGLRSLEVTDTDGNGDEVTFFFPSFNCPDLENLVIHCNPTFGAMSKEYSLSIHSFLARQRSLREVNIFNAPYRGEYISSTSVDVKHRFTYGEPETMDQAPPDDLGSDIYSGVPIEDIQCTCSKPKQFCPCVLRRLEEYQDDFGSD
ncbi:hypothetical protein VNI00_019311 [Paramarasmius palmivorus]|uniref:F-box domain-containing protein n=1 Tax=Paramarasmius palmivorus TaxID=297713 RepID=A0AAW0APD9_9AGAR